MHRHAFQHAKGLTGPDDETGFEGHGFGGRHGQHEDAVLQDGVAAWNDGLFLLSPAAAGFNRSMGGSGGSSGGTTTTTSTTTTAAPSHLVINMVYDASVDAAPAGFKEALAYAAHYFESIITSPETVTIKVGYGEVGGTTLGPGTLGAAAPYGILQSYGTFKSEFASHATSAEQLMALANMGADPTGGGNIFVPTSEAKALGLLGTYTGPDAVMGFALDPNGTLFTYDPANRAVAGKYDFIGVAEHEISHALGRVAILGSPAGEYSTLDLLRYASPGTHALDQVTPGYFSIDGGKTNLDWYATSSDLGDWAASAGNDANTAFVQPGTGNYFTPTDLVAMSALGYALA